MLANLPGDKTSILIGLWCVLYVSDYFLAVMSAKKYHTGAKEQITFEKGYQTLSFVGPIFKHFTPRFLSFLVLPAVAIWFVNEFFTSFPEFSNFMTGSFLFLLFAFHIKHIRTLFLLQSAPHFKGSLVFTQRHYILMSAIEFFSVSLTLLAAYLVTWHFALLGGATTCFLKAAGQWMLTKKMDSEK